MNIELISLSACICDLKGNIVENNTEFLDLLERKNSNIYYIAIPADRQKLYNTIKLLKNGQKKCSKFTITLQEKKKFVQVFASKISENNLLFIFNDITNFKKREEELLSSIIASEEKERRRLANELHDNLSPILSTIKLYTNLIKKKVTNIQKEYIQKLEEITDLAIKISKEISYNLTPSILEDFGLAVAIEKFVKLINTTQSLEIQINTNNYKLSKRIMTEYILYHTVKELINNTIKHSKANKVIIDLRSTDNLIILYYKDNGKGFNINQYKNDYKGLGIRNIINKITSFGGSCEILSSPGQGMKAIITLPIQKIKNYEFYNYNYRR